MCPEQKPDSQRKYSADELLAMSPSDVADLADAAGLHEAILQTARGVTPTSLWIEAHPEFSEPRVWGLIEQNARESLHREAEKGSIRPVPSERPGYPN